MRDNGRRLVIFDMDGTLIDSAGLIAEAMDAAFNAIGQPPPGSWATRGIVGLSLPVAVSHLAPDLAAEQVDAAVAAYKLAFVALRAARGEAKATPLFHGARPALAALAASGAALGVATGKGRRGLEHILESHDLRGFFHTTQSADDAPSKPHPGMALNALKATGTSASRAVVIGDTTFDINMARAAGLVAVGVAWGCHTPQALRDAGAAAVIEDFTALDGALDRLGLGA